MKPIEPFYTEEESKLIHEKGYTVKEDAGRCFCKFCKIFPPKESNNNFFV
ncbi:hypothetical protein [Sedimentibacter sp.]|nr:hypothetical protein [Sedimentibacter sp.]